MTQQRESLILSFAVLLLVGCGAVDVTPESKDGAKPFNFGSSEHSRFPRAWGEPFVGTFVVERCEPILATNSEFDDDVMDIFYLRPEQDLNAAFGALQASLLDGGAVDITELPGGRYWLLSDRQCLSAGGEIETVMDVRLSDILLENSSVASALREIIVLAKQKLTPTDKLVLVPFTFSQSNVPPSDPNYLPGCWPEYMFEETGSIELLGLTLREALLEVIAHSPVEGITFLFENRVRTDENRAVRRGTIQILFPEQPVDRAVAASLSSNPCKTDVWYFNGN